MYNYIEKALRYVSERSDFRPKSLYDLEIYKATSKCRLMTDFISLIFFLGTRLLAVLALAGCIMLILIAAYSAPVEATIVLLAVVLFVILLFGSVYGAFFISKKIDNCRLDYYDKNHPNSNR